MPAVSFHRVFRLLTISLLAVVAGLAVSSAHAENAVRGVFDRRRRRRAAPRTPTEQPNDPTANPPIANQATSSPTDGQRPLRRWSVAELIARALATASLREG